MAAKKQDSVEVDGDAAEPEDTKKKKVVKKGGKEETKEKGIISVIYYRYIAWMIISLT